MSHGRHSGSWLHPPAGDAAQQRRLDLHGYTTDQIEDSGQHEVLNWFCLLGAMEALGRKPDKATFIETWAFVSPVVFAYYNA